MEIRRHASVLIGGLLLLAGCDKSLPTEPPPQPTPTPAGLSLSGTWTGAIASANAANPVAVTAHVTQTGPQIQIQFQVAGASGTSNFSGSLSGNDLDGQFCRGNLCGCSHAAGRATTSQIHLQAGPGNVYLDCFGNSIDLSR